MPGQVVLLARASEECAVSDGGGMGVCLCFAE